MLLLWQGTSYLGIRFNILLLHLSFFAGHGHGASDEKIKFPFSPFSVIVVTFLDHSTIII